MKGQKNAKYHPIFQWLAIPCIQMSYQLWYGYTVTGRENIPKGGCVVCPNHNQNADPPLAAAALGHTGGKLMVMAKKELFDLPLLWRLFYWLGGFPVDRGKADLAAIKTAMRSLKDGKKLLIFPQGTRGTEADGAKEGAAMLAVKTGVPILPMYISEDKKFRRHVHIIIGEPFLPPAGTRDYAPVADDILRRIYALRGEADK